MNKLVITNGTGGAGKDTFCEMVKGFLPFTTYRMYRYSYVELVRRLLRDVYMNTDSKTKEDRRNLAYINRVLEETYDIPFKDCCSVIDGWLKESVVDPYDEFPPNAPVLVEPWNVIMLDVRNPKVIERFKERYKNEVDVITLLVDNGTTTEDTEEDKMVFDYTYDYVVSNTRDMDFLRRQAESFARKITKIGGET